MNREIIIKDSAIIAVNRSKEKNVADSIVYRDRKNQCHEITFEVCAKNYQREKNTIVSNCIGERNIHELYFCFYTSGLKTKITFKKRSYISRFMNPFNMLKGTNESRFLQLQKLIDETKYITYDLTKP